jgi:hypothetical protein
MVSITRGLEELPYFITLNDIRTEISVVRYLRNHILSSELLVNTGEKSRLRKMSSATTQTVLFLANS